jgi:hypothetical protein
MLELKTRELDLDIMINGTVYHGRELTMKELGSLTEAGNIDELLKFIGLIWPGMPPEILAGLTVEHVQTLVEFYKDTVQEQKKE